MSIPLRNVGIVAHVDAGKTTLTEQFLFAAGATQVAGSVDKGTSVTDSMTVERERGISVRLSTASFLWDGVRINLIDTPGHVDFCAEVERSLKALDCAVLVISAVEGVQAHTSTIFTALRELKIPTIFFINKIDRIGADVQSVLTEIRRELTTDALLLQMPCHEGQTEAHILEFWRRGADADEAPVAAIIESVVENDDDLLNRFLEGESCGFEELDNALATGTSHCQHYPVLLGVAKNSIGVKPLLDAIIRYLPAAETDENAPLSGVVFRIDHTEKLGRVAAVRLFSGQISTRDPVQNSTRDAEEKVSLLKKVYTGKYEDIKTLKAGDIGIICGFEKAQVGDILGSGKGAQDSYSFAAPLLTVMAIPESDADFSRLSAALKELTAEDPMLALEFLPDLRQLHLKISGWIQIEILEAVLKDRYDLKVKFSNPTIIYRETPSSAGFGFERYWMPKPCWAIMKFLVEPLPVGSGVQYESKLGVNDVAQKYQNEVERTVPLALGQGPKGWEVTDLKITLVEGEDHPVHTRPGDFIIATPMAMMNALVETGTTLLEPMLSFRISASRDLLGSITSDLSRMRATFGSPEISGERFIMEGKIPASTSLDYPVQLASRSGGKAKISTRLFSYEPCTDDQGQTTEYRGISPLDRSKYILKARGGITVGKNPKP